MTALTTEERIAALEVTVAEIQERLLSGAKVAKVDRAKQLVESFVLEAKHLAWAHKNAPSVPPIVELEAWKDRCRQGDPPYTVGKPPGRPIRDPQAAFYTACRNAEAWGTYRKPGQLFQQPPRVIKRAPMAGGDE